MARGKMPDCLHYCTVDLALLALQASQIQIVPSIDVSVYVVKKSIEKSQTSYNLELRDGVVAKACWENVH